MGLQFLVPHLYQASSNLQSLDTSLFLGLEASSSKILQDNCSLSLQAKVFGGPGPQCEETGPFFSRCLAATFCTVDPGPPTKLVQTSRLDRPYQLSKNEA